MFLLICIKLECQELTTAVDVHLPIFLKTLTFDKNFISQNQDTIFIHLLYQNNDKNSIHIKNLVYEYILNNKLNTLNNKPLIFLELAVKTEEDFKNYIKKCSVKYLYIARLKDINLANVTNSCNIQKILTFTGVSDYLENGAALSLGIRGNKPEILLNLENSKKQGANFNSRLLNLVKLVD